MIHRIEPYQTKYRIWGKYLYTFFFVLTFSLLNAQSRPEARDHHAATFDQLRNRLVVFGGNGEGDSGYLSDLWEYDGKSWMKVDDHSRTARSSHALAFITSEGASILLGGVSKEGGYLSDMGFWQENHWQDAPTGPSARYSPAMAYDEARDVLVLFSGAGRGEDLMWEYSKGTWEAVKIQGASPTPRVRSQMVYDHVRETLVLFGGYADGKSVGDMWEWDGKLWTRLQVTVPPARNNHFMASDRKLKKIVLFGGKNRQDNVLFGDTWEWDGTQWELISETGPEPRDMTAGAFDANLGRVVLFGGRNIDRQKLDDLWSWDGEQWHLIEE